MKKILKKTPKHKDLDRYSSCEDTEMANKQMKRCPHH